MSYQMLNIYIYNIYTYTIYYICTTYYASIWEVFQIQSGPLNCNSEKVHFLDAKFMMILLEKVKQSFVFGLIIIKVNTGFFQK